MPANLLPQIDALLALGFVLADDGTLVAPSDSAVTFTPIGNFLVELRILIGGKDRPPPSDDQSPPPGDQSSRSNT